MSSIKKKKRVANTALNIEARDRSFLRSFAPLASDAQKAFMFLSTIGQMAPPKCGRVQECHLIHVAFKGGGRLWEVTFALMLSP